MKKRTYALIMLFISLSFFSCNENASLIDYGDVRCYWLITKYYRAYDNKGNPVNIYKTNTSSTFETWEYFEGKSEKEMQKYIKENNENSEDCNFTLCVKIISQEGDYIVYEECQGKLENMGETQYN